MELKIIVRDCDTKTAKEIIEDFMEFEKEHSPHCTLSVEVEIN